MTEAVDVVLSVALSVLFGIAIPAWIVRFDMRRLAPERLARAWPDVSFWVAVVTFGFLCLPVHFWKTRRSLAGLLLGLLWCVIAILPMLVWGWLDQE